MELKDKIQAFNLIAASLSSDSQFTYMSPPNDSEPLYMDKHPFDPDFKGFAMWMGFSSDDWKPMLRTVLRPSENFSNPRISDKCRPSLTFYLIDKDPKGNGQYDVVAEMRDSLGNDAWMVGGLTNYSGSGGHAYEQLKLCFEFLAELYGIIVMAVQLPHGSLDIAHNLANAAYREAQE